jgi:hypothetical protein
MNFVLPATSAVPAAAAPATTAWVKNCNAKIIEFTMPNNSTGEMDGSVMCQKRRAGPAPSSAADSYCSCGTSSNAARMMIISSPDPHSTKRVSEGLAMSGSLNHSPPSMPSQRRIRFTGPNSGLNTNTNTSVAAAGGASAGR